jgi:hypothetical protein
LGQHIYKIKSEAFSFLNLAQSLKSFRSNWTIDLIEAELDVNQCTICIVQFRWRYVPISQFLLKFLVLFTTDEMNFIGSNSKLILLCY